MYKREFWCFPSTCREVRAAQIKFFEEHERGIIPFDEKDRTHSQAVRDFVSPHIPSSSSFQSPLPTLPSSSTSSSSSSSSSPSDAPIRHCHRQCFKYKDYYGKDHERYKQLKDVVIALWGYSIYFLFIFYFSFVLYSIYLFIYLFYFISLAFFSFSFILYVLFIFPLSVKYFILFSFFLNIFF
jgi:hypothetical protein